jgi:hypothetical protein
MERGSPLERALHDMTASAVPSAIHMPPPNDDDNPLILNVVKDRGGFPFFVIRVERQGAAPFVRGGSVRADWRHLETGIARGAAMCAEALAMVDAMGFNDTRVVLKPPTSTLVGALIKNYDRWEAKGGVNSKGKPIEGFGLLRSIRNRVRVEDISVGVRHVSKSIIGSSVA